MRRMRGREALAEGRRVLSSRDRPASSPAEPRPRGRGRGVAGAGAAPAPDGGRRHLDSPQRQAGGCRRGGVPGSCCRR